MKKIYEYIEKHISIIFGLFLIAAVFNLVFEPMNIIYGGTNGLGMLIHNLYDFNIQITIIVLLLFLFLIGFLFLDKKSLRRILYSTIIYSIFLVLTKNITDLVVLDYEKDLLLIYVLAAILTGFGSGLIYRKGYAIGGIDIIKRIMYEKFYISMGKSSILLNTIIVLLGASVTNNYNNIMYAAIILYIIGYVTDRVILGVSEQKAFQIVTKKEQEIKDYVNKQLKHKVTIFNVKGGYSNKKETILFCVIPTAEYFLMKNAIKEIDQDAFFVVSDSYETRGYE